MEYKKHTLDAYNIHTIKTDKFKNCHLEINFRNKIDKNTYTKRLLLFDLLLDSCELYKTTRDNIIKSEELYGAALSATTSRVGNYIISSVSLDFINPKYTEENMLDASINYLFDIINYPNIVNGEFDQIAFNKNKNKMKQVLETEQERITNYAVNKLLANLAKDKAPSIAPNGYLEDLELITASNILKTYYDILRTDICDIFIYGNLDMDKVVDLIKSNCQINSIKTSDLGNIYVKLSSHSKPKKIYEYANIRQGTYIQGYTLDKLTDREKRYVMPIFNVLFGDGSLDAKLYKVVREENSLCYNIRSVYQKFDQILLVITEIDKSSYSLCEKLISKCFKEMINGDFSLDEIENAKKLLISNLEVVSDSQTRTIAEYYFKEFSDQDENEEKIRQIKSVTKEEIQKVSSKIFLHTTFFLSDKEDK